MKSHLTLFALLPAIGGALANTCNARGAIATTSAGGGSATAVDPTATLDAQGLVATDGSVGGSATGTGATGAGDATGSATGSSTGSATGSAAGDSTATATAADATGTGGASDPSSTGTLKLGDPSDDCKCGYKVSGLADEYFPYRFSFSFSTEADGEMSSAEDLKDRKWKINDGEFAGGEAYGNRCYGSYKNVKIDGGDLVLSVPPQSVGPEMNCAEIAFSEDKISGGVFQTTAKLSGVEGTCEAFWLNHSIATQYADELDIEVISSTIDTKGIWSTNWPPDADPHFPDTNQPQAVSTNVLFPGGDDPTSDYNNYTIAWLKDSTPRYYNGEYIESPKGNVPTHNMMFVINNWSNGGAWTEGPPTETSELRVKSVLLYYKTEDVSEMSQLDGGCSENSVCSV